MSATDKLGILLIQRLAIGDCGGGDLYQGDHRQCRVQGGQGPPGAGLCADLSPLLRCHRPDVQAAREQVGQLQPDGGNDSGSRASAVAAQQRTAIIAAAD
ncbi:MAG: hypothetical protein M0Q42_04885 [Xanthomonadales bacterium]|nr:hypothetical protein [Xanthomonadales bacterium]